jgi:hypothetical protein
VNGIAKAIRRAIADGDLEPPCNYTQDAVVAGVRWHYHAETEPHRHLDADDAEWEVEFAYFSRAYRFVFWHGGKLRIVTPRAGGTYKFRCRLRHAVILKEDVDKLESRRYWKKRFESYERDGPLACVFRFIK